jgi:alpha-tubulin suppressor-like RCC1 family protein
VATASSPATSPGLVPGLAGVTSVAAGGYNSLAVGAGGVVSTWGWNNLGQLGVGSLTTHASPVVVPGVTGARTVTAGIAHGLVTAPSV